MKFILAIAWIVILVLLTYFEHCRCVTEWSLAYTHWHCGSRCNVGVYHNL